jgi:sec-independent protein translocase protein TatA
MFLILLSLPKFLNMETHLLFIGGSEIFIVLLVALLLFGSKRIPEVARGLGKGLKEFKKATEDIKREITETEISKDIKDINKTLKG